MQLCECGCGAMAKKKFIIGHDGRLRGRLLREVRTGPARSRQKAMRELQRRGWTQHLPDRRGTARQAFDAA